MRRKLHGHDVCEQSTVHFVVVNGDSAWMSPRGTSGMWNCNRWTTNPDKAYLYPSWQAADKAIRNHRAAGHVEFNNAKYCDLSEFVEIAKGEVDAG